MLLALLATAALVCAFPWTQKSAPAPEAGVRMLRIWVVEKDAAGWLRECAAAYEKQERTRVYLRAASLSEAEGALDGEKGIVPPDAVVMPGLETVLALRGYALFVRDAEAAVITPAPTAALFHRPTAAPLPKRKPPTLDWAQIGPVLCLSELAGCVHDPLVCEDPAAALTAGKAEAAVLTAGQAGRLTFGCTGYPLPGASVPVTAQGLTVQGQAFLSFLRDRASQFRLKGVGLYSVLPDVRLYDESMPLFALIEEGLAGYTVSSPEEVSTTLNSSRWVPSSASM